MEKISSVQGVDYYRFTKVEDIERFRIDEFTFFKGFGIIDYPETFKAWLRKFPRPIFIAAIKEKDLVGWVYIDEWKEGVSSDGQSVYVLRAIETKPRFQGKRVGARMVMLGLQQTIGYMIVKPVSPQAERFFQKNGFLDFRHIPNCTVNLEKHPGYYVLTPTVKKKVLNEANSKSWQNKPIFIEKQEKQIEQSYDWSVSVEEPKAPLSPNLTLKIFYNPVHAQHRSATTSPENPARLESIYKFLAEQVNIFDESVGLSQEFYKPTDEDILRAHTKRYLDFVRTYSKQGGGFLGDDTYFNKDTFISARSAVGGAISAVKAVTAFEADYAFALIRPPGHHASKDKHGGFCIFNNAAIAAKYAQVVEGKRKVMILDWDAHAANGTQDIFYTDPDVLLLSIHQTPLDFYPNMGFFKQMGKGPGLGRNINLEMPKGSGNAEYQMVFSEMVEPIMKDFNPDFVICCNGFDPYYRDSLTQLNLTAQGFFDIAKWVGTHLRHRTAILLEGGYHEYCDKLTYVFINGLLGRPLPYIETADPLQMSATNEEKIRKIVLDNIKDWKMILKEYYKF